MAGSRTNDGPLLVIMDDATSEIYYAQLVEAESTRSVTAALREVIEKRGVFCTLYSDRAGLSRCSSCFPAELYPPLRFPKRTLWDGCPATPDNSLAIKTGQVHLLPTAARE